MPLRQGARVTPARRFSSCRPANFPDDARPMPPRDLPSLRDLLPKVLARLAKESGGGDRLIPVWEELVGPSIARNARPFALTDGTLVVRVTSARWAQELTQRAGDLVARLGNALGEGCICRLQFELLPAR